MNSVAAEWHECDNKKDTGNSEGQVEGFIREWWI